MTTARLWILGAADPEMSAIESLLTECGEHIAHAQIGGVGGRRVTAGEAYRADCHRYATDCDEAGDTTETWYLVECTVPTPAGCPVVRIDHHRPGDPGYGVPPAEFLRGSSLGQIVAELARLGLLPASWTRWRVPTKQVGYSVGEIAHYSVFGRFLPPVHGYYVTLDRASGLVAWGASDDERREAGSRRVNDDQLIRALIPATLVLTAAADHCLGAAYAGQCPGVDPDKLMRWRAESRAEFQGRSVDEILADVAAAKAALEAADGMPLGSIDRHGDCVGCGRHIQDVCGDECECDHCECPRVRDMRGVHVPELPEAGTRYGIAYVADGLPTPDGRVKVVCSGTPEVIEAFLSTWAPRNGLVDCYGDPARGFAAGHILEKHGTQGD